MPYTLFVLEAFTVFAVLQKQRAVITETEVEKQGWAAFGSCVTHRNA